MYHSSQLMLDFEVNGKAYKCAVNKFKIEGHRPEEFYRIPAKSGNIDIFCHNGQWVTCNGSYLPANVLDALGAAIIRALKEQL